MPCGHQGLHDVKGHCKTSTHTTNLASWKKQSKLNYPTSDENHKTKVLNAKVMVTNFLVQHNLPLATADHHGPLFKSIFTDSKIASSYLCAETKTFTIVNETFAPHCLDYIVKHCKTHPYSVDHDGSNNTGIQKMDPVSIRVFDVKWSKTARDQFFNMCLTEGVDSAKSYKIFEAIEASFGKEDMPWSNCVALSVDNTNAMVGRNNSVASRFLKKTPCVLCSRLSVPFSPYCS